MGQLLPAQSELYFCAPRFTLMIFDSRIEEENGMSRRRELT